MPTNLKSEKTTTEENEKPKKALIEPTPEELRRKQQKTEEEQVYKNGTNERTFFKSPIAKIFGAILCPWILMKPLFENDLPKYIASIRTKSSDNLSDQTEIPVNNSKQEPSQNNPITDNKPLDKTLSERRLEKNNQISNEPKIPSPINESLTGLATRGNNSTPSMTR